MSIARIGLVGILLLCSLFSFAQEVHVTAGFFADSLTLGDKTKFFLTARYPKNFTLLFPDSTSSFSPFEFEKKVYFPTKTIGDVSYDSVIYTISTFEIDRVQRLRLPVFQALKKDSIPHYSNEDSILLTPLVTMNLDSIPAKDLPLKINVAFQKLPSLFNYPVVIIVLSIALTLAVVVWLIFGKRIRKHFKTKRMLKLHQQFLQAYSGQVAVVKNAFSSVSTEKAVVSWKKYMEQLESTPYTKWTTRETESFVPDDFMIGSLKTIDSAIYGYYHDETLNRSLDNLKAVADQRFTKRLEEVRNG